MFHWWAKLIWPWKLVSTNWKLSIPCIFIVNGTVPIAWLWSMWSLKPYTLKDSDSRDFAFMQDIVTCQRGRVSNKLPGQRQDTGPGILWSVHRWTRPAGEPPTCGAMTRYTVELNMVVTTLRRTLRTKSNQDSPILLRQGEPGTSQYDIIGNSEKIENSNIHVYGGFIPK